LDIGEGKEINLEKCSRAKLQQQCLNILVLLFGLTMVIIVQQKRISRNLLHSLKRIMWPHDGY
ncbi:hypothetical protein RYX36_032489, partial [Vicia faba]